jgi:hypothetical protein
VRQEHGLRNFARSRNSGKTGETGNTRRRGKKRRRKNRKIINVKIIAFTSFYTINDEINRIV